METTNVRRYDMLVRVKEFGLAHADLFPADSLGARAFAEFSALVDRLNVSITAQWSGRNNARKSTKTKTAARADLRTTLDAIIATAKGVAIDNPKVADKFRLPIRNSVCDFLATARQFANDAAPLAAAFVSHGLPATFLADLQRKIDALEQAAADRTNAKGTSTGAGKDIAAAMDTALTLLDRLDALVKNRAGNDQYLLGAWESARRVERKAVRSKGGSTPAAAPEEPHPVTPAPPAAAPAPQPAAMAPAPPAKVA